jgi:hypothetical protein
VERGKEREGEMAIHPPGWARTFTFPQRPSHSLTLYSLLLTTTKYNSFLQLFHSLATPKHNQQQPHTSRQLATTLLPPPIASPDVA